MRDRDNALAGHGAYGWFDSDDAAGGSGGEHNRPIRFSADRQCTDIRSHSNGRSGTGPARVAVEGVRITGLPAATAPAAH